MRGSFIVVEGCDRSGKTTQCTLLVDALKEKKIKAEFMRFPDRSTRIGEVIDEYLNKKIELSPQSIHLLFSANRWEFESKIRSRLEDNVTLIVDRYSYSGVAYSSVKPGMNQNWCKNVETGLPKPDLVLCLELSKQEMEKRSGFGNERYELADIQEAVSQVYKNLQDSSWKVINADKSEKDLTAELLPLVEATIAASEDKPIYQLW